LRAVWIALALCGCFALPQADAASVPVSQTSLLAASQTGTGSGIVLVNDTSLVTGSQSAVFSFQAPAAGTVVAQVTNVDWPQALSSLSFVAGSATKILSSWSESGSQQSATLTFDVSGPGMYFADIKATAGGPLDLGVYSMCIKFTSAVPLPSTAWLLAAGLVALLVWRRAGRRFLRSTWPAIPAGHGA
jgi:hypothetical protein